MELEKINKERFNQIIDEAYDNYINNPGYKAECVADLMKSQAGQLVLCPTIEEFVNKCKTNKKFSEKWGLKIEERLLDHIERKKLMDEYTDSRNMFRIGYSVTISGYNYDIYNKVCDSYNIPIKKIIIEYNNEIVEIYE